MKGSSQLESLLRGDGDPHEVWPEATRQLRACGAATGDWRDAWDRVFGHWDETTAGPRPMWFSSKQDRDESNLNRFMAATGHGSFDQLYQWSVSQPGEFWKAVAEQIGVKFAEPYSTPLDLSGGVTQGAWFSGAKLNIVESCFSAETADRPAIICGRPEGGLSYQSYGELQTNVHRVTAALRAEGFEPGDRIAIVMAMTPEAVTIYLGVVLAGCVAVSIADSFAAPEIAKRLEIAEAKGVFCVDAFSRAGRVIEIYERIIAAESPKAIVLEARDSTNIRSGDMKWEVFLAVGSAVATPFLQPPDAHINILFSSGTTGDPKAIPWNQTTPIKAAADGFLHNDIREGDVVVWPTNLGWMMGPWLIFASLMNRATIGLYNDAPVGDGFGRFVEAAKVSIMGVVPTFVRTWRTTGCMEPFDWSTIRCFSSTGEASNADDSFYLSSLAGMKPVIEYCGGTEVGGGYITSSLWHDNAPSKFSTPALGSGIVILDENGSEAGEGELFLIPPAVGMSTELLNRDHAATYYEGTPPGPSGEQLRRHGDHFCRLPGGFYVAGGRVDDTMNLGGIKVSSAEIERVLNRVEGVGESAAVAVTAQDGGPETLAVFVVSDGDRPVKAEELRDSMNAVLKADLNPLFRVSQVRLTDSLPRTASNKVMRRKLREQLGH